MNSFAESGAWVEWTQSSLWDLRDQRILWPPPVIAWSSDDIILHEVINFLVSPRSIWIAGSILKCLRRPCYILRVQFLSCSCQSQCSVCMDGYAYWGPQTHTARVARTWHVSWVHVHSRMHVHAHAMHMFKHLWIPRQQACSYVINLTCDTYEVSYTILVYHLYITLS